MFDLSGLANNISSQVIILLVILGLVSLVVAVATQGAARGIATVCLILILIALVLVLKDAEKIGTWLKDLIFKTKCRLYFPNKRLAILMEYNYTREFKQPHKIYSIKGVALPFAPNGIRLEQIFVGIGILILLLIFAIISFVAKINFFYHNYC
ncbi:TcpE family conjugal transfer membrane protein [Enterococcus faecalis]|uniref:TcpE family conjugal transfer membrane protein n=3 Tax=Enterococcus faecalis TaxID=1351 RepID=UPI00359C6936